MGKTNFNMQLTDEEKEIMDFAVEVIFKEYGFSKADMVSMLVKQSALVYLNMDIEHYQLSDDFLLTLLYKQKMDDDFAMIQMVGVEKYKTFVSSAKEKDSTFDAHYWDNLIKQCEQLEVKK